MAKKVVASLRNKSGVKYAKLIRSVKSEKTGAYVYKEEIVIEDHVKDILAGKSQQDIINEIRAKEKEAEAAKLEAQKEEVPAAEVSKEEPKKEEAPTAEVSKEEPKKEEAPTAEVPKEEPKKEEAPIAEVPKEEPKKEEAPAAEVPKEDKKSDTE